jgi:hypothetical protein
MRGDGLVWVSVRTPNTTQSDAYQSSIGHQSSAMHGSSLGLERAAVLEAARRCGQLGAKVAFVSSDQQFYYSRGFVPHSSGTWWETPTSGIPRWTNRDQPAALRGRFEPDAQRSSGSGGDACGSRWVGPWIGQAVMCCWENGQRSP